MNVVLIAPSGGIAAPLERLGLLTRDDATVTAITWSPADVAEGVEVVALGRPVSAPARAVTRLLSTNAIGRNLLRLTPLDGGRRLARVALKDPRVQAAFRGADLIAVLERDGILTGWKGTRRWAPAQAPSVYGLAPAETLLKTLTAAA